MKDFERMQSMKSGNKERCIRKVIEILGYNQSQGKIEKKKKVRSKSGLRNSKEIKVQHKPSKNIKSAYIIQQWHV